MSTNPEDLNSQIADEFKLRKFIIVPALFALVFLIFHFANFNHGFGDQGDFGTFGDFLGGTLNPVLGFVTVVLLVSSLNLQVKELKATREQLQKSAIEAERTRKEMESQVSILKSEAKLKEVLSILENQSATVDRFLSTPVMNMAHVGEVNFYQILNDHTETKKSINSIRRQFLSQESNLIQTTGLRLKENIKLLAYISIEYNKNSTSKPFTVPSLTYSLSLIEKFNQFHLFEDLANIGEKLKSLISESEHKIHKSLI